MQAASTRSPRLASPRLAEQQPAWCTIVTVQCLLYSPCNMKAATMSCVSLFIPQMDGWCVLQKKPKCEKYPIVHFPVLQVPISIQCNQVSGVRSCFLTCLFYPACRVCSLLTYMFCTSIFEFNSRFPVISKHHLTWHIPLSTTPC